MSVTSSNSALGPLDLKLLFREDQDEIVACATRSRPYLQQQCYTTSQALRALSEWHPKALQQAIAEVTQRKLAAYNPESLPLGTTPYLTVDEIKASDNPLLTLSTVVEVQRWVAAAPARERRAEAATKILNFIKDGSASTLDLSALHLSTLPSIFHHPAFQRLMTLKLRGNQLTTLPYNFGSLSALQVLYLGSNRLTTLPDDFSSLSTLEELDLSGNQLATLPDNFGLLSALEELNLSSNQLATLPGTFDSLSALQELSLSHNPLITLPDCFGAFAHLVSLSLSNTRLTGLPNSLLYGSISSACWVNLENVPLSDHVRTNLRQAVSAPLYHGPRFNFSVSVAPPPPEGRPLSELLHELYSAAHRSEEVASLDAQLAPLLALDEEPKSRLAMWLGRLPSTADYRAGSEVQKKLASKVFSYLQLAATDATFRDGIFKTIVSEACDTCGDRVALSILNIGVAVQREEVIKSRDPKALAKFLQGAYALQILEEIARVKVSLSRFIDPIEVYLIYPTKLKGRLGLPIDIDSMLYPACASVSEQELADAENRVKAEMKDPADRLRYLASHPQWNKLLSTHPLTEARYKELAEVRERRADGVPSIPEEELQGLLYKQIEEEYKKGMMDLSEDLLKAVGFALN